MALEGKKNKNVASAVVETPQDQIQDQAPEVGELKGKAGRPKGALTRTARIPWTRDQQIALKSAMVQVQKAGLPLTLGNVMHLITTNSDFSTAFASEIETGALTTIRVRSFLETAAKQAEKKGRPSSFPELATTGHIQVDFDSLDAVS